MSKFELCPINKLGRVVIPARMRKKLGLKENTPVEIFFSDGAVHIQRHHAACIICQSIVDVTEFKGKPICTNCILSSAKLKHLESSPPTE